MTGFLEIWGDKNWLKISFIRSTMGRHTNRVKMFLKLCYCASVLKFFGVWGIHLYKIFEKFQQKNSISNLFWFSPIETIFTGRLLRPWKMLILMEHRLLHSLKNRKKFIRFLMYEEPMLYVLIKFNIPIPKDEIWTIRRLAKVKARLAMDSVQSFIHGCPP